MHNWKPDSYLRFAEYRARPAADLLARVTLHIDAPIVDLGCGPGNLTIQLPARWPDRKVIGVDKSEAMIARAREQYGDCGVEWRLGDLRQWRPDAGEAPALVFSNAAMHWIDSHETEFPRLMQTLGPGGVLAVQMPTVGDRPFQRAAEELARSPEWRERTGGAVVYREIRSAEAYYRLLAPHAAEVDLWETVYVHVLDGEDPVLAWVRSTVLMPYLSVMSEEDGAQFEREYAARAREIYPPESDGRTLLPMRRLFIVARRAS